MTTVFNVSLVFSSASEDDPQQSVLLSRCWTQLNVLICYVKDVLKHGKDPAKVWAIPEHFATSGTDVEVRDLQQKTRGYRVQLDGCPTRKGQSVWIQAWKSGPANLVGIPGEVRGRTGGRHLLFHLVGRFGEVCVLVLEKACVQDRKALLTLIILQFKIYIHLLPMLMYVFHLVWLTSLFEHLDHVRSGHCHILITVTSLKTHTIYLLNMFNFTIKVQC